MVIDVACVLLKEVLPLGALDRREMGCKIVRDSLPGREFGDVFLVRLVGVIALDGGCAARPGIVLGEATTFARPKHIIVYTESQVPEFGTRIVAALAAAIGRSEHDGTVATLFNGQHLARFYERFGPSGPETLYGMSQSVKRHATREAGEAW
jgi:hypothetical protein